MDSRRRKLTEFAYRVPVVRAFRHSDFRLLWAGALFSFMGTHIQRVAQDWEVYDLTKSTVLLAWLGVAFALPVSFFGPFLGVYADIFDRRKVLVVAMCLLAGGAAFLGAAIHFGFIAYWHFVAVALMGGFVQTVEMPTRQSIVGLVVPKQDLPAAVPAQAMTFNVARVVGPVLGGIIAAQIGAQYNFFINAVSFFGLALAALMIRTDISERKKRTEPVVALVKEGLIFTLKHRSLRTLFLMECATSVLAMFYLQFMAVYARDVLGLRVDGFGKAASCIGIGAFTGLVTLTFVSHYPIKLKITRIAMFSAATCLIVLGTTRNIWIAYAALMMMGMSTIAQFNTTNTLFQLLSPQRLRGRVISMHMWAVSGIGPAGMLLFGWLSERTSLQTSLVVGGSCLAVAAVAAVIFGRGLVEPQSDHDSEPALV